MINERYVRKFCKDDISKILNYDKAVADTTQTWDCHHRTEIWWNCTKKELIENECYYNRKACELIFLTHAEHIRLHMTAERRQMLSKLKKGVQRAPLSAEHKAKIRAAWQRRKQGGHYDAKMG